MRFFIEISTGPEGGLRAGPVLFTRIALVTLSFRKKPASPSDAPSEMPPASKRTAPKRPHRAANKPPASLLRALLATLPSVPRAAVFLLARLHVRHLRVAGTLGVGDAAQTALLCGALAQCVYALCAHAARDASRVSVDIRPEYANAALCLSLDGIFSIRAGHCIYAGARLLAAFLRNLHAAKRRPQYARGKRHVPSH